LAGICVLAPGAASAMPNGLPHAEHLSNIDQVRRVCNPRGDAGGGRTSMGLTAITGLPESTGAHGVGTTDGAVGNNNANLRGLRAPHF
jgi:hypothetical protein